MQDYRELKVWQRAHAMTLSMYRLTANFPPDERFGLTSQLRRAMSSIPFNLAEGSGKHTDADRANYVQTAIGSSNEVEYGLLLVKDWGYLPEAEYTSNAAEIVEIRRMLIALVRYLRENRDR